MRLGAVMFPNPWFIVGAILAVLAAGGAGYVKGHRDADKTALVEAMAKDLANAKSESAEWLRQATVLAAQAREAAERQQAAEADAEKTKAKLNAYETLLASRPPGACAVNDDDLRFMPDVDPGAGAGEARPSKPAR